MFARSTTILGNPQNLDAWRAYVHDTVMPAVLQMDGCVGLSMLCDRDSGLAITTTAWADAKARRTSADKVLALRAREAEILGGAPEINEWEIAVLHRLHATTEEACACVVWGRGDTAAMDRLVHAFPMAVLRQVDELPGFCSMSVLVNREDGRTAISMTYANCTEMERASDQALVMRERFTEQTGIEVTETATFDVALVQMRVPEMV
ncbi:MAG TPA: hypothetical protein VIH08_15935 [Blastococcus sp.]|jgi:hypothetical protein